MTTDDLVRLGEVSASRISGDQLGGQVATKIGGYVCYNSSRVIRGIFFDRSMATSTGIRIGSSERDLRSAYPNLAVDPVDGGPTAEVRDGVSYIFDVNGGVVRHISLQDSTYGCGG